MARSPCLLLATALLASSGLRAKGADDERVAWRYQQQDLTVTLMHRDGKEWVAERSDGKRPEYQEIKRTDEFVELQNRDTKLFVRLRADQAYWRRPKDEDWTPWVKGPWIPAPPPGIESPPSSRHRIRLAYFVPNDRKPTTKHAEKIRVIMAIVAELYLTDLRSQGFQTDGLQFETDNGELQVRLVRGEREASYYNAAPGYKADEQWRRLLPEVRAKVGDTQRQVIVVFAETYDDGPAEHLWPGVIARGAYFSADGGLAVFSSHLLRDEFCALTTDEQRQRFFDMTPVPGRRAWGHRINSPRCEFVEDGIGAVAHELGHALGLPHDRREDSRDIMGNGFRNLRRNLGPDATDRVGFSVENARLLMSSRYLAGDLVNGDDEPPKVTLGRPARTREGWSVPVTAADNQGLRAIVFVDRTAGSVVAGRELKGKRLGFQQLLLGMAAKSNEQKWQVIVTDDGGNQTRTNLGMSAKK